MEWNKVLIFQSAIASRRRKDYCSYYTAMINYEYGYYVHFVSFSHAVVPP